MKKVKNISIFLILILGVVFFLNPDLVDHKEKIAIQYEKENPISGSFGVGTLFSQALVYKSYYLFSTTEFTEGGTTISFGCCGYIYITQSLDLNNFQQWMLNGGKPSFKTIKDNFTDE